MRDDDPALRCRNGPAQEYRSAEQRTPGAVRSSLSCRDMSEGVGSISGRLRSGAPDQKIVCVQRFSSCEVHAGMGQRGGADAGRRCKVKRVTPEASRAQKARQFMRAHPFPNKWMSVWFCRALRLGFCVKFRIVVILILYPICLQAPELFNTLAWLHEAYWTLQCRIRTITRSITS